MADLPAIVIADELLTEAQAITRLRCRESVGRAWLRALGIAVVSPSGGRLYRWAEILAALPRENEPLPEAPKKRSGRLKRTPL